MQMLSLQNTFIKKYLKNYSGLSVIAWKGIMISLIESSLIGICYFFSLYFINELHLTITQAGALMSLYGVGTILGSIIGGRLSDYISPLLVSIFSILLQAIAFIELSQIKSIYFLIPNLLIIGMASYGFITSNHVWILSHCTHGEPQRLKAINLLSVVSNLGLGISAIAIGTLTTKLFPTIFIFIGFLLFVLLAYLVYENNIKAREIKILKQSKDFSDNLNPNKYKNTIIVVFALACLFLAGMIISQTNSTYPLYLQKIFPQMGIKSFSILFTINTFMVVLLQAPISNLFVYKNKIITMGLGLFLIGCGMFILTFSHDFFTIAILACLCMTFGEIIFFSIAFLICYENGLKEKKGHATGIYRMVYATSRIFGPLLGGVIYAHLGGAMLWYMCGAIGFFTFIIACFFEYF